MIEIEPRQLQQYATSSSKQGSWLVSVCLNQYLLIAPYLYLHWVGVLQCRKEKGTYECMHAPHSFTDTMFSFPKSHCLKRREKNVSRRLVCSPRCCRPLELEPSRHILVYLFCVRLSFDETAGCLEQEQERDRWQVKGETQGVELWGKQVLCITSLWLEYKHCVYSWLQLLLIKMHSF